MMYYAVVEDNVIHFIGTWAECKEYIAENNGSFETLTVKDRVWTTHDDDKQAVSTLTRELDHYKMLYQAANNDSDELIEKNSDLITLITSMSKFINTHLEGR